MAYNKIKRKYKEINDQNKHATERRKCVIWSVWKQIVSACAANKMTCRRNHRDPPSIQISVS